MTKVACNAKSCSYNDCRFCNKKTIDVEGLFAKSKIGTFCQSFTNPQNSAKLMSEIASELSNDNVVKVSCSANYCEYNKGDYCEAKEITIGNESAKYRSETQCDSFKLK